MRNKVMTHEENGVVSHEENGVVTHEEWSGKNQPIERSKRLRSFVTFIIILHQRKCLQHKVVSTTLPHFRGEP